MMIACACLLTLFGAVLIYLTHVQQRFLRTTLPNPMRIAGIISILGGAFAWWRIAGPGAGIAGLLTTLMLAWVALPYLAWISGRHASLVRASKR